MMQVPQVPSTILQALSEILAAQSPQLAARLKQRLTAALEAKGEHPFDERKFGFKGFRDFLERGTQGLFYVRQSDKSADVVVSLLGAKGTSPQPSVAVIGLGNSVRSDIWQAFTNPDAGRARYLNRHTFAVRHFLRGEDSPAAREVAESLGDFVEIEPISSETQLAWMRQFIEEKGVQQPLLDLLQTILTKTYTSGVNAAFTGALGELGNTWRETRVRNVINAIRLWADNAGVPLDKLNSNHIPNRETVPVMPSARNVSKTSIADGIQNPREQAVRLLDMLTNDDISRVVVPILLSTLLVRGKN